MPWKYPFKECWENISEELVDEVFYCNIHQIQKNPLSIRVDGKIHTFKKKELEEGDECEGKVVKKTKYGVFIEMGHVFDWRYGSIFGLMHRYNTGRQYFISISEKDEITVKIKELKENGDIEFLPCVDDGENPEDLVGKDVWVEVERTHDLLKFYVKGEYEGELKAPNCGKRLREEKKKLNNGEIIQCRAVKYRKKCFQLRWKIDLSSKLFNDSKLADTLEPETVERLNNMFNSD